MPIGPQVPDVVTTVTPDTTPTRYISTQGPAPNGYVVADDVLAVHQIVLNVQEWVRAFVPGAKAQSFVPVDTACAVPMPSSTWTQDNAYGGGVLPPRWIQQSAGGDSSDTLYIPLSSSLPYKGKITGAIISITPPNTHVAIPVIRPVLRIVRVAASDSSSATIIAEEYDDSPNVTFYNSAHPIIAATASPVEISNSYRYWLALVGEYDTNSLNGLRIDSAQVIIEE